MTIRFACPNCSANFSVDDAMSGKAAKCSQCGHQLTVPAAGRASGPDPSAAPVQQAPAACASAPPYGPPPPGYGQVPQYAPPPTRPINRNMITGFAICMVAGLVLFGGGYALMIVSVMERQEELVIGAVPMIMLGSLANIGSVVFHLIILYKMWEMIQGPWARSTPGKAIGFLFIPFYNYYWIFQVYYGWAQDYNRMIDFQKLPVPRANESRALWIPITSLAGIIVCLLPISIIANIILLVMFLKFGATASEALIAARQQAPAGAATG